MERWIKITVVILVMMSQAASVEEADKPKRRNNLPILSGSAYVGQLYNAKMDQILHDRFLWVSPIKTNEADITSVETDTYIEETIIDRMNHMSVEASLKVSLFAGLISISGSASYLSDEIQTDEHVRMTINYRKKGRQLTAINAESVINSDACAPEVDATHVITEVQYGFNAFLTFDVRKTKTEDKQMIAGSLKIVIKKIPKIQIEGYGAFNFSGRENRVAKDLSFHFHGDAVVDPPPQTFEDAVKVYKSLAAMSKANERVVSFSLAPLSEYCDKAQSILVDISKQNIKWVSEMMVDFEIVNKVFRRLKSSNLALNFQTYKAVIMDLEQRFEVARSSFTARIQQLIPKIRSKKASPTALTDLLQDYNDSPYEKEKLVGLLSTRQKEIETAEFIIYNEKLSKIQNKYIDLDHTGDLAECIIGHTYTLQYALEILPKDIDKLGDLHENGTLDENDKWFNDESLVGKNRPLLRDFIQLAKDNTDNNNDICFLISLNRFGESENPFQLNLLKEGDTIVSNFRAPQKVQNMDQVKREFDSVELDVHHGKVSKLELASAKYELKAKYWHIGNKVGTEFGNAIEYKSDIKPETTKTTISVENLQAGANYKIQFSVLMYEGKNLITEGETSDLFFFFTSPSSPPVEVNCETTEKSIVPKWKNPTTHGMNVNETYKFKWYLSSLGSNEELDVHGTTEDIFYEHQHVDFSQTIQKGIIPATSYQFHVTLEMRFNGLEISDEVSLAPEYRESKELKIECKSKPPTPYGLGIEKVTGDTVSVSWKEPQNLDQNEFKLYNVWLQESTNAVVSPLKRESIGTSYNWTGLESATAYQIRISVATNNFGESEKSQPQTFHTKELTESDKSAVEKLQQDMTENIASNLAKFKSIIADISKMDTTFNSQDSRIKDVKKDIGDVQKDIGSVKKAQKYIGYVRRDIGSIRKTIRTYGSSLSSLRRQGSGLKRELLTIKKKVAQMNSWTSPQKITQKIKKLFGCTGSVCKVGLKSMYGKYVVAEDNGRANANRRWRRTLETFYVYFVGGDKVQFKNPHHKKYLVAERNGDVNANRRWGKEWETWRVGINGHWVTLKSHHGKYLKAESNGALYARSIFARNTSFFIVKRI